MSAPQHSAPVVPYERSRMSVPRSRTASLLALIAGVGLSGAASAQSADDRAPGWSLGIGAAWAPSPYRSYDTKALPCAAACLRTTPTAAPRRT